MIYSNSNLYLSIGDRLPALMADINLKNGIHKEAHSHFGNPSLAMVTFFQYLEKLSDRQAAEATGARIDWKYALHLSMNYPGLDPAALCDFRQSLLSHADRQWEFQRFLELLKNEEYCQESQVQSLDTLGVVAEVCARTRLDRAMSSMRHILQALATHNPEWLLRISLPHWFSRYDVANHQFDLTQSMEHQQMLAEAIGADIAFLLKSITQANEPQLASLNEVQELHQVWREQFEPNCLEGVKLLPYCYFCSKMQPTHVEQEVTIRNCTHLFAQPIVIKPYSENPPSC